MKIDRVCINIRKITGDDIATAREEFNKQEWWISPLKMATQSKMNALGHRNNEILDKLIELKELIEKNKPEE